MFFFTLTSGLLIDFIRGDAIRGLYFGDALPTSQIIGIGMFLLAGFMLWRLGAQKVNVK
jgi:hypothetical protein